LVLAGGRAERRDSGMIKVAMAYWLSSPPRFETVCSMPLKRRSGWMVAIPDAAHKSTDCCNRSRIERRAPSTNRF
jgi:hypothetical protein